MLRIAARLSSRIVENVETVRCTRPVQERDLEIARERCGHERVARRVEVWGPDLTGAYDEERDKSPPSSRCL
jgi:hypothetical protein